MAPLNTTKPVFWLRDFIKYLVWILVRRSILWLNQPWYVQFYLLMFWEAGLFVTLMFRMYSYMAIYLKMFICLNLRVFHILNSPIMCASQKKLSMD